MAAGTICASALENFEKNTAYFTNEYGLPESTKDVKSYEFLHPSFGFIALDEEFSVRVYKRRELEVEAVFRTRDMRLAAVSFRRSRPWQAGELHAMLATYGARWRELGEFNFVSAEGVRALYRDRTLYFVSALTLGTIEKHEDDRRREAEKKS